MINSINSINNRIPLCFYDVSTKSIISRNRYFRERCLLQLRDKRRRILLLLARPIYRGRGSRSFKGHVIKC